jgi:tetratricopeptide (TPR) repeat protein
MKRSAILLCAALCLGAAAHVASAQPAGKVDEETKKRAKVQDEAGRRAYNTGEFDRAIDAWKAGYDISGEAYFLYNIAQAHKKKDDYEKAIFFYKSFLRADPENEKREKIEGWINELQAKWDQKKIDDEKKRIEEEERQRQEEAERKRLEEEERKRLAAASQPVGPPAKPFPMKKAGMITGAAGLGVVAVGFIFGGIAMSKAGDLSDAAAAHEPWVNYSGTESSRATFATLSGVGIGLGLAAVAAGGAMYYLGLRADKKAKAEDEAPASAPIEVIPVVAPGGAGLLIEIGF